MSASRVSRTNEASTPESSGASLLAPEFVYLGHGYVVANVGALLTVVAFAQPAAEVFRALQGVMERVAVREGTVGVHVFVDGGHGPPDEQARGVLKQFLEQLDSRCAGLAMCLGGDGFVAAARRSIASLAVHGLRTRARVRIVGSNIDGASWVLEQLGRHAPPGATGMDVAKLVDRIQRDMRSEALAAPG